MMRARWHCVVCVLAGAGLGVAAWGYQEPYPFRKKTYDPPKETIIESTFDHGLPEAASIRDQAITINSDAGKNGSGALVIPGKRSRSKAPLSFAFGHGLGMARFQVDFDLRGDDFPLARVYIIGYDRNEKEIGKYHVYSWWGHEHWTHAHRIVDIENEQLFKAELVIHVSRDERFGRGGSPLLFMDNLKVTRHDVPYVKGNYIRSRLQSDLSKEGGKSSEIANHIVTRFEQEHRTSYFHVGRISVDRRYLQSEWRQRLHAGSTYRNLATKLDRFVLGVVLDRKSAVEAAKRLKKSLPQMYDYIIADVKDHGFNTIWLRNFTADRETFCGKAAAKGLKIILTENSRLGVGAWRSRFKTPKMPAAVKKAIDRELPKIAQLKGLLAYELWSADGWQNNTDGPKIAAMWAKVRQYMKQVAPGVKLLQPYHDWRLSEGIQTPPPDLGVQDLLRYYAYNGRPYGYREPTWFLYYYGDDWWRRHVDYGLRRHGVPYLWILPVGREFHLRCLSWKPKNVDKESGFVYDEKTKTYSGWRRYQWPARFIRSALWTAVCANAKGVILDEYGPSRVHQDVTLEQDFMPKHKPGRGTPSGGRRTPAPGQPGVSAREESEAGLPKPKRTYPPGIHKVDALRQYDSSELDLWAEAAKTAKRIGRVSPLLLDLIPHGARDVYVNHGHVMARLMTRQEGGGKFVLLVNRILYDAGSKKRWHGDNARVNANTGFLSKPPDLTNFEVSLRVDSALPLINMISGSKVPGEPTPSVERSRTYKMTMTPGQVGIYLLGHYAQYSRLAKKYGLQRKTTKSKRKSRWTR